MNFVLSASSFSVAKTLRADPSRRKWSERSGIHLRFELCEPPIWMTCNSGKNIATTTFSSVLAHGSRHSGLENSESIPANH